MARRQRLICASADLADSGDGVRFEVADGGRPEPAFVVRFDGRVHAYLNRCAHIPIELDWMPGKFFDSEGLLLICSVHGAVYEPDSGRCLGGPCFHGGLVPVAVAERDGGVWVEEDLEEYDREAEHGG